MPSKTKIILLLLFWFCAGARPRPSAHEAPGSRGRRARRAPVRQCVDAPHARIHARSARAAVRGPGGVQFVLGEQELKNLLDNANKKHVILPAVEAIVMATPAEELNKYRDLVLPRRAERIETKKKSK